MKILGISCYYHDSAAALLIDGRIVSAAQEERFSRIKHDTSFPIESIKYCLNSNDLEIKDIDCIAFYEKPILKFERVLSQCIEGFPISAGIFISSIPSYLTEKLKIIKTIKKKLKYKKDIVFCNHHTSHAAGIFFISPFNESTIVTVDGVGEWATTTFGIGRSNHIEMKKEIHFPHSLGLLYSTITAYLGFSVNNSEYKVMGLSAYGALDKVKNKYYHKLKKIIKLNQDGSFWLDMNYFSYRYLKKMPSRKLCKLLGGKVRLPTETINQRHKDIAAALQMVYEEALFNLLNYVQNKTGQENLVLGGGCALNSVANGKILKNTKFKRVWIPPDPGDGGTSIGAALYAYISVFNNERNYVLKNPYLGPGYSTENIESFLNRKKIKYTKFKTSDELLQKTAKLIFDNNVIGWFQGKMEWGPRALGARSILSNPCNQDMKEILNVKVKHREKFRPFAPVVCEDDAIEFFECDEPIPEPTDFMLNVYPIKKKYHTLIPSVVHVDGTGRLQTIRKEQNELYYNLIKEFGKLSRIPILINTSFNIRGEPIVCSPQDAYKCMMGTEIDYLVIDKFLVKREDNLDDIWDSEKFAHD